MGDATYNKQPAFPLEKHLISGNERRMCVCEEEKRSTEFATVESIWLTTYCSFLSQTVMHENCLHTEQPAVL